MTLLKTLVAFLVFWGVIVLSLLANIQQWLIKQLIHSTLKVAIISLSVGVIVIALLVVVVSAKASQQLPSQPIAFPHTIHAGKLGIACVFCHRTVEKEPVAGIPSIEQCMFCHRAVARDNKEVAKLVKASDSGTPLNWLRVNRLPDTVHFDHSAHIRVNISCSTCHGSVEKMVKISPVRSLKMGDCLECHRTRSAPTGCATCHY